MNIDFEATCVEDLINKCNDALEHDDNLVLGDKVISEYKDIKSIKTYAMVLKAAIDSAKKMSI